MGIWVHQHMFKVGWLLTQNYQTTTIFYYTFFLPGVFVHEATIWLMAGILNVRAEQAISWPEKQEMGELKLNFVKIAPRISPRRRTVITISPLIVGLLIVWLIAYSIFHVDEIAQIIQSGQLDSVVTGLQKLIQTPDFWLWFYIVFTVGNTMYPSTFKDLKGWGNLFIGLVVGAGLLLIIGLGGQIFLNVAPNIAQFLGILQSVLFLLIAFDVLVIILLAIIENIIETVTGKSVFFRKGKMITLSKEEAQAELAKQKERERLAKQRSQTHISATPQISSVYELTFFVPLVPSKDTPSTFSSTPSLIPAPAPSTAISNLNPQNAITSQLKASEKKNIEDDIEEEAEGAFDLSSENENLDGGEETEDEVLDDQEDN